MLKAPDLMPDDSCLFS